MKRVSNKKPTNSCSAKELLYGRFVKSGMAIVGNDVIRTNSESSEGDCDKKQDRDNSDFSNKNTLDKAFEMSGGRTAHAAARHGSTLSGKLKRLQEQESRVCTPNKKSKNYYECKSDVFSNEIEAEMQQGKEKNKIVKGEAKTSQIFNGKTRVHELSLAPIEMSEQHAGNKLEMMIDNSTSSTEELTASGKLVFSSDRKTELIYIKKKKSCKDNEVVKKCSKVKSDPKRFRKRKKDKKNKVVQIASGEVKISKKKKTKKKRAIQEKFDKDENC